jgi:hypothetical protein
MFHKLWVGKVDVHARIAVPIHPEHVDRFDMGPPLQGTDHGSAGRRPGECFVLITVVALATTWKNSTVCGHDVVIVVLRLEDERERLLWNVGGLLRKDGDVPYRRVDPFGVFRYLHEMVGTGHVA